MAPFAAIIEAGRDVEVTPESFTDAISQLPELCLKWRSEKDEFLLSLIPSSEGDNGNIIKRPKAVLQLATTLFRCQACLKPISYPRILSHGCMTAVCWAWMGTPLLGGELLRRFTSCFPWNYGGDWVAYDKTATAFAVGLLEASGSDPRVTTAQQMDARNLRFVCPCRRDRVLFSEFRYFMNWRFAVEHATDRHSKNTGPWVAIDGDATRGDAYILLALRSDEKQIIDDIGADYDDFCCRLCVTYRTSLTGMKNHLQDVHELVLDKVTEEHYYKHPDAPPSLRAPYVISNDVLKTRAKVDLNDFPVEWLKEFERGNVEE